MTAVALDPVDVVNAIKIGFILSGAIGVTFGLLTRSTVDLVSDLVWAHRVRRRYASLLRRRDAKARASA